MLKPWQMVSPSQISTYDADLDPRTGCQRRWYLGKIAKVKVPSTEGQVKGSALHKSIEDWYLEGVKPVSPILLAGFPYWPVRSATSQIEKWFALDVQGWPDDREQKLMSFESIVNMPWGFGRCVGKSDYVDPFASVPLVVDFKNYKSFRFMPSDSELVREPAMITYARNVFVQNPSADKVMVKYVWHRTEGKPQAKEVAATYTREQADRSWDGLVVTIGKMRQTALIEDWQDVPPNWSACNGYGGCPHKDMCNRAKAQRSVPDVWGPALAPWSPDQGIPQPQDVARLGALLLSRADVPDRAEQAMVKTLLGTIDRMWEYLILPYDEATPRTVVTPDPWDVDLFRELVRWQGQYRIDLGDRTDTYRALIAFLTAHKTACQSLECATDKFCHCLFEQKRKGPAMNTQAVSKIESLDMMGAGPGGDLVIVYGAVYKAANQGAVKVLSNILAPIKTAVARENAVGHYLQAPFAKLRGDVVARGLSAVENLTGVLVVDIRDEAECEIARMLTARAALVVGNR